MYRKIDPQDIVGKRVGRLTVKKYTGIKTYPSGDKEHKYLCQCDCGNFKEVLRGSLTTGNTRSCGCLRKENASRVGFARTVDPQDIIGKKFGRLTVEKYLGIRKSGGVTKRWYLCRCECGNTKELDRNSLISGNTRTCGCSKRKPLEFSEIKKFREPKKEQGEDTWIDEEPKELRPYPFDIIGLQNGVLTCIDCIRKRKDNNWIYLVKCEKCGHEFELDRGNFLLGKTSCPECGGNLRKKTTYHRNIDTSDIIGKRFGKLTVLEFKGKNRHRKHIYLCRCDCGTEKIIERTALMNGKTKSCGCLSKELNHRYI